MSKPQLTKWVLARLGADGRWLTERDKPSEQMADVVRLEVLANIDWHFVATEVLRDSKR